ncbi:MAG TPA: response regulator [Blastocatellia bacterium]|nr:response regulator [Blastocatellia bacterium]
MSKPCVLVVEDNFDTRSLAQFILSQEGFDVIMVSSGETALRLLESLRPDVIVTDLMMPNMAGLVLIHTIRENPHFSDIPVIVLSAYATGLKEESFAAGATVVLEKPDGMLGLPETIRQLLAEPENKHAANGT